MDLHSAAQGVDGPAVVRHRGAEQEQSEAAALQDPPGAEHVLKDRAGGSEQSHTHTHSRTHTEGTYWVCHTHTHRVQMIESTESGSTAGHSPAAARPAGEGERLIHAASQPSRSEERGRRRLL